MKKILIIIQFFFVSVFIYPHGVNYKLYTKGVIGMKFTYEAGLPLANAKVRFFKPDNYNTPAFIKSTDENGSVFFIPDKKGEWIIMAKDNGGHVKRVNLMISSEMISAGRTSGGGLSFLQKVIIAAAVVWGFSGFAFYFKSRKKKA